MLPCVLCVFGIANVSVRFYKLKLILTIGPTMQLQETRKTWRRLVYRGARIRAGRWTYPIESA